MADFVALMGVKGGPAIRPGSHMPTSILVSLGGAVILVDAGLGASRGLCDQGVALTALDAVFVTHLHSDHYLELGPLLHTAWTAGLTREVPVYGPAGLERYWAGFLASMEADIALRIADEGRVPLEPLAALRPLGPDEVIRVGEVTVRAMRNVHPPLCDSFALRFEAGGRAIVLSGDTAYMPEMAAFAAGADLLVHEAMLVDGVDAVIANLGHEDARLRQHILRSHTAAADVGRVAAAAGVGHLAVNHFVPDGFPGFTDADWERELRRHWDGALTLGTDGVRIDL
ncbi:MBL fold metallo-hydrolase [Alphaproteobacteria bacterium GH1-50]|uniref:MBL fold metallo-hydrolase n=1 Tax=Kangsaoukella pontilimi TaxID=2691042 RepID=A0A7C9MXP5_9RHOB|nr:MBL fold metallo-hydrolase [Kangsaoukella pontilimi]MXQ09220.1 MBL fold metallo-hydrolase [Kangsaoukella pontilimi]